MGALGFLGGFSHAASESASQNEQNKLNAVLTAYKLKHELENDSLRQAYLLSRLSKPPSQGTGVKLTGPKGQEVWYPQTGTEAQVPKGSSFMTSQTSPITKTLSGFLSSKTGPDGQPLDYAGYIKLSPPARAEIYKEYLGTLRPEEALKENLDMARLQKLAFTNKTDPLILKATMDLLAEEKKATATGGATPFDIVPGTPDIDYDPYTAGD